ncbi:hypothetical protein GJ496_010258 [Pomphorhynchus laevis]|nr:hypothetical protein GJ496_010258 [Pomphorhynchus laevis]
MPKIISMDNIQRSVETPDISSGLFYESQQDKTEKVEQSSAHITNSSANALSADSESKSREATYYIYKIHNLNVLDANNSQLFAATPFCLLFSNDIPYYIKI